MNKVRNQIIYTPKNNYLKIFAFIFCFIFAEQIITQNVSTDSSGENSVTLFNWTNISEKTCAGTDQEELIAMTKEDRETQYQASKSFLFSTNITAAFNFMIQFQIGKF